MVNCLIDKQIGLLPPKTAQISSNLCLFFRFTKVSSSTKSREPRLSMATRRSSRSSSTDSRNPLFPNSCFINKKDIVAKTILTLSAEATIKAAAKIKMCNFYFQNKDLDLLAHQLQCDHPCSNHLLAATAVVFEKPLQWLALKKLCSILFLLFP